MDPSLALLALNGVATRYAGNRLKPVARAATIIAEFVKQGTTNKGGGERTINPLGDDRSVIKGLVRSPP